MKLYAISDLHVGFKANREAIVALPAHPEDWLILCGDIGDTPQQLDFALQVLGQKFAKLIWVPGNHELWTVPRATGQRGVARYAELVELCRRRGVLTPEDPFPVWQGEGGPHLLAPLFLLYDYSFRPDEVAIEDAVRTVAPLAAFAHVKDARGSAEKFEFLLTPCGEPRRSGLSKIFR